MMDRNTPNLSRRLVSLAKNPSIALSQEADVGVKWKVQRGWRFSQVRTLGCLWGGIIVHDGVDLPAGRHAGIDSVEKADELLMPVFLHAASENGAVKNVQRGKQGRGAMALIVMCHGAAAAFLQRQARLCAVKGLDLAFLLPRQL